MYCKHYTVDVYTVHTYVCNVILYARNHLPNTHISLAIAIDAEKNMDKKEREAERAR